MSFDELCKNIFQASLTRNYSAELLKELSEQPHYFLVAKQGTTKDQIERKEFAAYIDESKALLLFLTEHEAAKFAVYNRCMVDNRPLVQKAAKELVGRITAEYAGDSLITSVKVYLRAPLHYSFAPAVFADSVESKKTAIMEPSKPVRRLIGIDKVQQVLDTYELNSRRKLDPGNKYSNIHTLIESLIYQNSIDPKDLDRELSLPEGFTHMFCTNVRGNPGENAILKLLSYFGLQQYLYVFKQNSTDIHEHIQKNPELDKYTLKAATPKAERFKLDKIDRCCDGQGFFVYRLSLTSKFRAFTMFVSNPAGCVVGREFRVDGLAPSKEFSLSMVQQQEMKSEEEMRRLCEELEEQSKPVKKEPVQERSYEDKRKDSIIRYFRKRGIDGRAAEAKYKTLEPENDILDAFYKYVETHKFGKVNIAGYTAGKLVKELHFDPYEAHLQLINLRADPQNTKQFLKYRETDPQYQKKPKEGAESNA